MKIALIIFSLLFVTTVFAQQNSIDRLKANPDIVWMGEVITEYAPEYDNRVLVREQKEELLMTGTASINEVKTLKVQGVDWDDPNFHALCLSTRILGAVDQIDCYHDASLTQKHSRASLKEALSYVDTVIIYDPGVFEELIIFNDCQVTPTNIYMFKLRQLIYYNKKDKSFRAIPLAIAPVFTVIEHEQDISTSLSRTLFWFSPQELDTIPDLKTVAIDYVKRTYVQIREDNISIIKGDQSIGELLILMLDDILKETNEGYIGNTVDLDGNEPLAIQAISDIRNPIDTFITFDPETFEEVIKIVPSQMDPKLMTKLELIQDWVWNADTKELSFRFVGFTPIIDVFDEEGSVFSSKKMFVRRPDKDK